MKTQVLLCGVGGQGILFATRILSEAALKLGYAVIGSETHGMSQRGGSVTSHLKIGGFHGPLIKRGGADFLFCFERGEIFQNLTFLRAGGIGYVDAANAEFIPQKIRDLLETQSIQLRCFDASALALQLNAPLMLNLILIGFAAHFEDFPLKPDLLEEVVFQTTPPRFRELNLKAFQLGLQSATIKAS
ncbi:MAG: indolepyruvate oxidoreductase subunit beta [bacterium]